MTKKYQAPSVKKAFQILKLIADTNKTVGISDIAKSLKISKSTVHGITSVLEEVGVVRRDPITKRYALGFALFELGKSAYSQVDLTEIARPILKKLMDETQQTVFLGILSGEHVIIIESFESRQALKITTPIGTAIPLLAGAVGKALLGAMDEAYAKEIIKRKGIKRYTENTITDPIKYLEAIGVARKMGYGTDYEEYILGVRAVAAPVVSNNDFLSAVWAVGFKTSLDNEKMDALIRQTKAAAATISRRAIEHAAV